MEDNRDIEVEPKLDARRPMIQADLLPEGISLPSPPTELGAAQSPVSTGPLVPCWNHQAGSTSVVATEVPPAILVPVVHRVPAAPPPIRSGPDDAT